MGEESEEVEGICGALVRDEFRNPERVQESRTRQAPQMPAAVVPRPRGAAPISHTPRGDSLTIWSTLVAALARARNPARCAARCGTRPDFF